MDNLDLPQQLIILYFSFQKHKCQAWIIWIMHFQSLLALHGLQEKFKGIMLWLESRGVYTRSFGVHKELCWTRALGQHCPTNPTAPHQPQLRGTPPHSPTGGCRQNSPSATTTGMLHPQIPRGGKPGTTNPQHCCSLPLPPSSAMHYSFQWHFHC